MAQDSARGGNPFVELIVNVIAPALILKKLTRPDPPPAEATGGLLESIQMDAPMALMVALALPIGYGLYDLATRRKVNFFSVLGFVSTLLTGGLALLNSRAIWFAIKEAAIPLLFGAATLLSLRFGKPLVKTFLFNPQVIDTGKVEDELARRGNEDAFQRLLVTCSLWLGLSFLLSAVLNFGLALYLLRAKPGTPAFNDQLGSMQLLSFPVIMLPCMAVTVYAFIRMMRGVRELSGYTLEELSHKPVKLPKTDLEGP